MTLQRYGADEDLTRRIMALR